MISKLLGAIKEKAKKVIKKPSPTPIPQTALDRVKQRRS